MFMVHAVREFFWWVQTQRQVAAKSTDHLAVSPPVGSYHPIYHRHLLLLLLSPRSYTHFTVPQRVEG